MKKWAIYHGTYILNFGKGIIDHEIMFKFFKKKSYLPWNVFFNFRKKELLTMKLCFNFRNKATIDHEIMLQFLKERSYLPWNVAFNFRKKELFTTTFCFNFWEKMSYLLWNVYFNFLKKLMAMKLCFNFRKRNYWPWNYVLIFEKKRAIYHEMCILIFEKRNY